MSRSRAAGLVAAVAVLVAVAYLLRQRRRSANPAVPAPAAVVDEVAAPEPRSWDGTPSAARRGASPEPPRDADRELPLPTWVRLSIVGLALLAFFAVSLIATKQV